LAQHGKRGFINCNRGFIKGSLYDSSKKMLPKTQPKIFEISQIIPSPLMGEGEGGGGQEISGTHLASLPFIPSQSGEGSSLLQISENVRDKFLDFMHQNLIK
jgi:hypothetical protein